ncbi:hypothetical protein ACOMHN_056456 [Nucella lapillus]
MRLFQQQTVYNPANNPSPSFPPPPPFLPDQEEERRLTLLRESTTHLREGRHRLPTPDRAAIMDLSSSFKKRRLGKQQQVLSEITQRCREQEVTDLSSQISAKVELRKMAGEGEEDPASVYASMARIPHPMNSRPPRQIQGAFSTRDLRDLESVERRAKSEKGYKYFPARKIMRRQPTRLQLIASTILKPSTTNTTTTTTSGGVGVGLGGLPGSSTFYRDHPPGTSTTLGGYNRLSLDFLKGVRHTDPDTRLPSLDRQTTSGSMQQWQHNLQPKMEGMTPLLLPSMEGGGGGGFGEDEEEEEGYHGRLDAYFSSCRLPLNQRSRSFFDTSSISGRSYRSLHTSGQRPTGSRHLLRSMRSERTGAHVLHEHQGDEGAGGSSGGGGGRGKGGGVVVELPRPMDV